MKIYDISQELFHAPVYPGDPVPKRRELLVPPCRLNEVTLGSHSGTHMDGPRHFYREGKDISQVELERCVGFCKVQTANGMIDGGMAAEFLQDGTKRLLLKGEIEITQEAAEVFVRHNLLCIGVEGLTVGGKDSQTEVHLELLGAEVAIIEGLCMSHVPDGTYLLAAQPLKMEGVDGSPVRAVLIKMMEDARDVSV